MPERLRFALVEPLPRLRESGELEKVANQDFRGSVDRLLSGIGYGRVPAVEVVRKLRGEEPAEKRPQKRRSLFRRRRDASSAGISVSGHADVLVRLGRCCGPLPGDEVTGFVTRGRGVTVHVKDCPKAFELDPARRIDVRWDDDAETQHLTRMRVRSIDQPGLLAKITKTISSKGINIGGARIATSADQKAVQTFDLWLPDVATLNAIMTEIGRIKGLLTVERLRT